MTKRILAGLLVLSIILSISVAVFAADSEIKCTNITYVDAGGNPVTNLSNQPIKAKVQVLTNTTGKKPVLLVCSFKGGMINGVWHSTAAELTGEISVTFTPVTTTDDTVIEATVLEGFKTLNNQTVSAKISENSSTKLSMIKVNGEVLKGYSDQTNDYTMMVSSVDNIDIEAIPVDAGTRIEVTDAETIPGIAKIKVISTNGTERVINLGLYSDIIQLSKPLKISYKVGDEIKDISMESFDSNNECVITLPKNTFYVTVDPKVLSVTSKNVKVLDVDPSDKTFGENNIKYVSGDLWGYKFTLHERPTVNNLIPIKNEETKAVIYTSNGNVTEKYTISFQSEQPALISFNLNEEVKTGDKAHPIFIGGAAANNDNATPAGSDRSWAIANISDTLIGASMFPMYLRSNYDNNDGKNTWHEKYTTGEYFNFTADTDGTIYIVSSYEIKNVDASGVTGYNIVNTPLANDGAWRLVCQSDQNALIPNGYSTWNDVPRTYGSYGDNVYFARMFTYNNEKDRFAENALTESKGSSQMSWVYARKFSKNEPVSVYHYGRDGSYYVAFVKWDVPSSPEVSQTLAMDEEFIAYSVNEYGIENVSESETPETTNVLTVSGEAAPYSKVSFMLLDSDSMGYETAEATKSAYYQMADSNSTFTTNEIFFYKNLISGADGKWEYVVPMTGVNRKDLTLITNMGELEYIEYASTQYKTGIIPSIVGAAKETDDGTKLSIEISKNIAYISDLDTIKMYRDLVNKLKVSQLIKTSVSQIDVTSQTALDTLKKYIEDAVMICGVNEGVITEFDDAMAITEYDATKKSKISEIGIQKIVSLLQKDEYTSIADYQKKSKEQFALQHFNYNVNQASESLYDVFIVNNVVLKLDLSRFNNLNYANKLKAVSEFAQKLSESVEVAQINLNNISDELKKKQDAEYENLGGGVGGGGIGSAGKENENKAHNASAGNSITNEYLEKQKYIYSDMKDASWAADAVYYLNEKGIVNGYADDTFRPLNPITRAEFTKLIVSAFFSNKEFEFSGNFKDIATDEWYAEYVNIAYNMGIVSGDENGYFNPDETISRQDMAVIIYNAGSKFDLFKDESNYVEFSDDSSISDYAKIAVYTLKKEAIVNGIGDGLFAPKSNADRASAAKILYELILNNAQ